MSTHRAVIFGCEGPVLSAEERAFFGEADPLGFILFKRNCVAPEQVRALVDGLRASVGRPDAPVLVDQEGGRVVRLGAPHWREPPAPGRIGLVAAQDEEAGRRAAWLNARLIAADLAPLGIDVNCVPTLDLQFEGADQVVGDRSFGAETEQVVALGRAVCEGLMAGGVLPVIKHMPGHGRAMADSHKALPRVATPREALATSDFAPFRAFTDMPIGISAHVCYEAIDPARPATHSPVVIETVIRGEIGFDGLLLTDDLSMNALSGTVGERAAAALAAGCDVALHCNGKRAEMDDVVSHVGALMPEAVARWGRARGFLRPPDSFSAADAQRELEALFDSVRAA